MARKSGLSALTIRLASERGEVPWSHCCGHTRPWSPTPSRSPAGQLGGAGLVERWWGGVGARGTRWRAIPV